MFLKRDEVRASCGLPCCAAVGYFLFKYRDCKRNRNNDRGEELEVSRLESELEYDCDDNAVNDRAEHNRKQIVPERESFSKNDFADNNRCKSDYDCTGAHAHVRISLALRNKRAAHSDKTVAHHKAEYLRIVGVDAKRANHMLVVSRSAYSRAKLSTKEPVQNCDDCAAEYSSGDERNKRRRKSCYSLDARHERRNSEKRRICFSHNSDINRIQSNHRKNSCQYFMYLEFCMEKTCNKSGDHAGCKSDYKRKKRINTVYNKNGADGTAERKTAVACHVGNIQDSEREVDAERHNAPKNALRDGALHS